MTWIRNPAGREAVEALLASRTATGVVPGLSAAVVEGDRMVWAKGFGVADLASASLATPRTSYPWFSMTRIVTATATVKLAEEGKLDLDAPVTDYFPDFSVVSQPRQVSVRHLLGHSSGLANPIPIRWVRPASAPAPGQRAFVRRLLARHRRQKVRPRRAGSLLQPRVPGTRGGHLRGFRHQLRGIRAPGDPGSSGDGQHRLRPPGDERPRSSYRLPAPVATAAPLLKAALRGAWSAPDGGGTWASSPSTSTARPTVGWSGASMTRRGWS